MIAWSPDRYLRFHVERTRPARDLIAAVPLRRARRAIDLGCGPGNSTALLVERFPDAAIIGVDSSAEMLAEASSRLPGVAFVEADVGVWTPDERVDILFANAVFQWVPNHLETLVRLMDALTPGGVLAVQMPDNLAEPAHTLMLQVAAREPWAAKLADAEGVREPIPPVASYCDRLASHAAAVDVWRTVYYHALPDAAAIVAWFASTGLRPYLGRLDDDEQAAYLAAYQAEIEAAYPPLADGTRLLPFPRLFVIAVTA